MHQAEHPAGAESTARWVLRCGSSSGKLAALRKLGFKQEDAFRFLLAAVAGGLLALAFPKFHIAGLAWVAPGLLLFAACGVDGGRAFRIGYVGGLIYYLIGLHWLLYIPVKFLPIAGWIALSMYLALYPALWVSLGWTLWKRTDEPPEAAHPFAPELANWFMRGSWARRVVWCLQLAALWVALEMVLGRFLSGFPWDFLGVSQYRITPLIQISAVTGVYGVSFILIWMSAAILCGGMSIVGNAGKRNSWVSEMAVPGAALAAMVVTGYGKVRRHESPRETVKIALVQPSIPQTLIWDEAESENRFKQLIALTEKSLEDKPDIVVWPEASVPNMLRHHEETGEAIRELAEKHRVWAIVGSDDAERRAGAPNEIDFYNSAFAVSPEGELLGNYRKRRLVIFGEYIPFARELPLLKKLSPVGEGFRPGRSAVPFQLENLGVKAGILICFEDTFPHLVPEYVTAETDFLINLTNNGWFGESAAQWQHAATAIFRAVENRVPLVRCANNGLSCWVDEVGRMHDVYYPGTTDIYGAGYKIVEVPVLGEGEERHATFYNRHGDVFGWSCLGVSALAVAARFREKRKESRFTGRDVVKSSGDGND